MQVRNKVILAVMALGVLIPLAARTAPAQICGTGVVYDFFLEPDCWAGNCTLTGFGVVGCCDLCNP